VGSPVVAVVIGLKWIRKNKMTEIKTKYGIKEYTTRNFKSKETFLTIFCTSLY
jgi:hypothetical protein